MSEFLQQVFNGLTTGSTYAVVALGFGLIFGVMGVINLAHADIAMVGAYAAYLISAKIGINGYAVSVLGGVGVLILVLAVAMAVGGVAGLVLERVVIRPTRGAYVLIPFIATAGVSLVLENGAQNIFGVDPVSVPTLLPTSVLVIGGARVTIMDCVTVAFAFMMLFALRYYVRRTIWGLATRAVAERPDVAAACGVPINRVSQLTVGLASAMAGVAGATLGVLYSQASPTMGLNYGLKAFVCMLVAGNRHIEGIMAVGLTLGVLEAFVTGYISSGWSDAIAYGILLVVLVWRPSGLFGSYAR